MINLLLSNISTLVLPVDLMLGLKGVLFTPSNRCIRSDVDRVAIPRVYHVPGSESPLLHLIVMRGR